MRGYAIRRMGRNGKQSPARPRIELRQAASPEEAAAIAAAIEQFMRDTAPPPADTGPSISPWLRAGLMARSAAARMRLGRARLGA